MSKTILHLNELPIYKPYVVAHDVFMSGWGPAKGMRNHVIFPCSSEKEADIVLENCKNRTDFVRSRKTSRKSLSRLLKTDDILFSLMDREDSSRFYEPGGFSISSNY